VIIGETPNLRWGFTNSQRTNTKPWQQQGKLGIHVRIRHEESVEVNKINEDL
jgi:hypothetical protein